MCTRRANHMHVQTHWPQEKDITTKNGASHPPRHTHTHLKICPAPPSTSSDTQSAYMCAHERERERGRGWWFGERWQSASTVPTKYLCLHNTQGQTSQASCCKKPPQTRKKKKTTPKNPLGGWNVVLLVKGRMEGVFP